MRVIKKKRIKPHTISSSEEKFTLNLHSCISMHFVFHARCNDDEWCYCPFSKTTNKKLHEVLEFDSRLEPQFCSSNNSSAIVSHVKEKHADLLDYSLIMYLKHIYTDKFGDVEFMGMQWHVKMTMHCRFMLTFDSNGSNSFMLQTSWIKNNQCYSWLKGLAKAWYRDRNVLTSCWE